MYKILRAVNGSSYDQCNLSMVNEEAGLESLNNPFKIMQGVSQELDQNLTLEPA